MPGGHSFVCAQWSASGHVRLDNGLWGSPARMPPGPGFWVKRAGHGALGLEEHRGRCGERKGAVPARGGPHFLGANRPEMQAHRACLPSSSTDGPRIKRAAKTGHRLVAGCRAGCAPCPANHYISPCNGPKTPRASFRSDRKNASRVLLVEKSPKQPHEPHSPSARSVHYVCSDQPPSSVGNKESRLSMSGGPLSKRRRHPVSSRPSERRDFRLSVEIGRNLSYFPGAVCRILSTAGHRAIREHP